MTSEPGDTRRSLILPGGKVDPDALRDIDPDSTSDLDNDDAPNRAVFQLQRDLNKRLDKYLTDRVPFMSRTQLQRLIDDGAVTVNNRQPKASTRLRKDDVVAIFIPPPPSNEIQPEPIPFSILYEDDVIIVLNKQSGIIVHPARSHLSGTMINGLAHHFRTTGSGALSGVGGEFARPGVVHRLDRNTTGCIVFAKDDEAHWKLGRQFEHRTVDKRYIALVHGHFEPNLETIDLPIGPHPSKAKGYREKYVVRHDDLGKPSVTICRVRARYGTREDAGRAMSLVELELKTGRTHQIRVHLSHLGYPIVGDDMYGGKPVGLASLGLDAGEVRAAFDACGAPGRAERIVAGSKDEAFFARQALHAATLAFAHPISEEPMHFTAPLPDDLLDVIALAGCGGSIERLTPHGATADLETLLSLD